MELKVVLPFLIDKLLKFVHNKNQIQEKIMKNFLLRLICFVCFVIAPIFVLINTPNLKQFYCAKSKDLCLVRVYNMYQQKPAFKEDFKISLIKDVKPNKCDSLWGLYKQNCVAITTNDGINHYLKFSFKDDEDTINTAEDIKTFLINNGKEYQEYKLVAEKEPSTSNVMTTAWGIIILFGLLISLGIIKETTNNYKGLSYKEQLIKMIQSLSWNHLKTLPKRLLDWFRRRFLN